MMFRRLFRRRDPVEIIVVLCGAAIVVVFSFFTARGDLDRYVDFLLAREIPPLIEVVEKEEVVPVSPLEQWAQEFPEASPFVLQEVTPVPSPTQLEEKPERPTPQKTVRAETPPPSGKGAFLQAGAFSQEKNAQAMVDTLRRFGYNAVIERASGMYRVRVYGFPSLEEAQKAAAKLRSQGIECFAGK
ncbi:MAG: SPOR domain-containing protein [Candidatus Caldatribacterium sp.]|nr:SPOR domain-containing protein [Candidatus Caldatribacterium sp.]